MIAVDLDGTLAYCDGWKGPEHIGKVIEPMMQLVIEWLNEGKEVCIFTARIYNDVDAMNHLKNWLVEQSKIYNCPKLSSVLITNVKTPNIEYFWDDRAISVEKNTGLRKTDAMPRKIENTKSVYKDTGTHYRYSYKGINLDPARILSIYNQKHLMAGTIVKKALCAGNRGHKDLMQDIDDIICAAQRWKEMIEEDCEDDN